MTPSFWRKWHRGIAFPASAFLLFAAITGVVVAMTEFVGEEEPLREATRAIVSLTVSGFVIYLTMRRRNPVGIQKVFW